MSRYINKKKNDFLAIPGAFNLACAATEVLAVKDRVVVVNTLSNPAGLRTQWKNRSMKQGRLKRMKREKLGVSFWGGCSLEGDEMVQLSERPTPEVRKYIRAGFEAAEIPFTTGLLGVPQKELADKVGISVRTFQRKLKENTRLSPEESDRLYRIQKVSSAVLALFEGRIEAMRRWLKTPLPALDGETPLAYSDTEPGAKFVLELINRLEHGIFS